MMLFSLLCVVSFLASGLTFFSGFGLGTILMPVLAIFFPVDLAIAMTAVVHLLNNLFKTSLVGRFADKRVLIRFGIPAMIAAYVGAWCFNWVASQAPLWTYSLGNHEAQISLLKLVIAALMMGFAFLEMAPQTKNLAFDQKYLGVGGAVSGFFGGLSGHQGALRSAFLIRSGLSKEAFIGTTIFISCLVDITRLFVYRNRFSIGFEQNHFYLMAAATVSAFVGAYLGSRFIQKVTVKGIQVLVASLLFILSLALAAGVI